MTQSDLNLSVMRAAHDQRQQEASSRLFEAPPLFAVMLSKGEGEALEHFNEHQGELWKFLFRYARVGYLGTCIAVIDRDAEELP